MIALDSVSDAVWNPACLRISVNPASVIRTYRSSPKANILLEASSQTTVYLQCGQAESVPVHTYVGSPSEATTTECDEPRRAELLVSEYNGG